MSVIFQTYPFQRDAAESIIFDITRNREPEVPKALSAKAGSAVLQPTQWSQELFHLMSFDDAWLGNGAPHKDRVGELLVAAVSPSLCGSNKLSWISCSVLRSVLLGVGLWHGKAEFLLHGRNFYQFIASFRFTEWLLQHLNQEDLQMGWLPSTEIAEGIEFFDSLKERFARPDSWIAGYVNNGIPRVLRAHQDPAVVLNDALAEARARLAAAYEQGCEMLFFNDQRE